MEGRGIEPPVILFFVLWFITLPGPLPFLLFSCEGLSPPKVFLFMVATVTAKPREPRLYAQYDYGSPATKILQQETDGTWSTQENV